MNARLPVSTNWPLIKETRLGRPILEFSTRMAVAAFQETNGRPCASASSRPTREMNLRRPRLHG